MSEYTHTSLSEGQQSALVEAFGQLSKRQHKGISVGSVLVVNDERVAGMARCARGWSPSRPSLRFGRGFEAAVRECSRLPAAAPPPSLPMRSDGPSSCVPRGASVACSAPCAFDAAGAQRLTFAAVKPTAARNPGVP